MSNEEAGVNTAPTGALCCVYSHVLWSLTCGIWFARVAHEFQAEINMNYLFEQGENVASCPNGWLRLWEWCWGIGSRLSSAGGIPL
jgi:hypothetical protein